ncbi:MAG: cell division protein FtsH [Pirellulales bacterium]|nr:cell division protein FtsH [Pirellulales bacterium]
MNDGDPEYDETLTAYHEAGHAVVAYVLGGRVDSVQLGGEADEVLPERFGDCRINWGPVDEQSDWQRQREVLTILAGPVAEMIYSGEAFHPACFGPCQHDWRWALAVSGSLIKAGQNPAHFLERLMGQLHRWMQADPCWAAIAAVADELLAHESLDEERLAQTLGFWLDSY